MVVNRIEKDSFEINLVAHKKRETRATATKKNMNLEKGQKKKFRTYRVTII